MKKNNKHKLVKKLYFLIESDKIYKHSQKNIIGKIVEVVVSNEKPCILMPKNGVIASGGDLYEISTKEKIKIPEIKQPKINLTEFDRIKKNLDKLRKLR